VLLSVPGYLIADRSINLLLALLNCTEIAQNWYPVDFPPRQTRKLPELYKQEQQHKPERYQDYHEEEIHRYGVHLRTDQCNGWAKPLSVSKCIIQKQMVDVPAPMMPRLISTTVDLRSTPVETLSRASGDHTFRITSTASKTIQAVPETSDIIA
jgi:hypothetical protein